MKGASALALLMINATHLDSSAASRAVLGGCANRHNECEKWAKLGECPKNSKWMKANCAPACGICGKSTQPFVCPEAYREEKTSGKHLCRAIDGSENWGCPEVGYQKISAPPFCEPRAPMDSGPDCGGVSPSGVKWIYVMPQHTATGSVVRYLTKLNIFSNGCSHQHEHRLEEHAGTYAAFTFVQNPFRRVISNAAFRGVFDAKNASSSDVLRFRSWVMAQHAAPVYPISELMGPPGFMDLYGRVSHLADDLSAILRRLGYTQISHKAMQFHCISSCGAAGARAEAERGGGSSLVLSTHDASSAEQLSTNKGMSILPWYDGPTASKVVSWFESDFKRYNYSTSLGHVWTNGGGLLDLHLKAAHLKARQRSRRAY